MKPSPILRSQNLQDCLWGMGISLYLTLMHAEHVHFEANPPKSKTNP